MNVPAAKILKIIYLLFVIAAFTAVLSSCVTNFPKEPFLYKQPAINIQGKYSAEERRVLQDQLEQQLHDSMRVRWERKFLIAKVLKRPPVFDSANMSTSQRYMENMLHTLGYLRDSIHSFYKIDTVEEQKRVTVNFDVVPGKLFRLDSISYNLLDSVPYTSKIDSLQKITTGSLNKTVIHKGDPFSQYLISSELDRIADLARNNGYLKFGKEQLLAVWDTVGRSILTATTDITEQLQQLEELRKKRENPTADLEIRLRGSLDTSRLTRYYIGEVKIYPDTDIDTLLNDQHKKKIERLTPNQFQFISYRNLFKPGKLIPFIYLRRGELYSQSNFLKTQSRFSNLPAWRLVTVNQIPRPGTDSVDFEILLIPAKQYNASINFDVSKNQGNVVSEGNLVGLGTNLTLVNKNFGRAANIATTNFRYGIELSSRVDSIQTQQFVISNTIQFPRLAPRTKIVPAEWSEFAQTFLSTNLGYTDRINYYRVFSLNTSLGWETSLNKKIIGFRFPNIEYNFLERRNLLDSIIKNNRSYQYIFSDGLVLSGLLNWNVPGGKKYLTTSLRGSLELAGLPGFLSIISPNGKAYHFVKLDAEYSALLKTGARKRSSIASRFFLGVGKAIPFAKPDGKPDSINYFIPFFRQYYAGGPSSMRAWNLRKLGPGSTIKSFDKTIAPDRFGDMRLEFNLEYRIYLAKLLDAYPMETALFTDMGNIWFLRKNEDFPNGEFRFNRLLKDLAIGVGTGLRIDFGFLLARFDLAWKAKDPSPSDSVAQNKWFYNWNLGLGNRYGTQFQLGINYPF